MSITFHKDGQLVHIRNKAVSYVMEVVDGRYLVHRYFGKAIRQYRGTGIPDYFKRGYNTEHDCSIPYVSFDDFPFEYPVRGHGDYGIPALSVIQDTGIDFVELTFKSWRVIEKKPEITGLPSTFSTPGSAETLEILCEDLQAGIQVYLYYTLFDEKGIIARHQKISNTGKQMVTLQNVQSLSLELPPGDYDVLSLYGTHAKEGNRDRHPVHHGIQQVVSSRGSSSQQQPFMALLEARTTEHTGDVYAVHLVYSGNFTAQAQLNEFETVRLQIGINRDMFSWKLEPGEVFETPEGILNYSPDGLNGMSQNFHWLYQNHLMQPGFVNQTRPVLLNSWESMYYDVSLDQIERQAELARQLGIELFVLDDGWFRKDNSSRTSMGDWVCNEDKLPGGISRIADMIHDKGMKFGLWFEPEGVSPDSQLYCHHPDWALQIPGYEMVKGRHEFLLDLSRKEVREYLISVLDTYIQAGTIDYIKWDMNRPLTDVNSLELDKDRKGEISHRYILGLYEILDHITKEYPDLLIEGCSSGGARFDPGMLYYVSQNWTSDNTDALDRLQIQSGYSLLYPPIAMGAHVSITPNHQTGRLTPLATRFQVARLFNLGYELDLGQCTEAERGEIARQIFEYKKERKWICRGTFYRHETPDDNHIMWSVTSEDQRECIVIIVQKLYTPLLFHGRFHITSLKPDSDYRETGDGKIYGGDELTQVGITVPLVKEDFHVFSYHYMEVEVYMGESGNICK